MKFNTKEERNQFIEDNLKLVDFVIGKKFKYYTYNYDYLDNNLDDIRQIGYVGLIKAVDSFDENKNIAFSSYAFKWIMGSIYNSVIDVKNGVRFGRKIILNKNKVENYLNYMSVDEVAKKLNLEVEDVIKIKDINLNNKSLNEYRSAEDDSSSIYNNIPELIMEINYDEKIKIDELLNLFPERTKDMISKYVFMGYSQQEIANHYNISQQRVGKIIKKSLKELQQIA